MKEINAGYEIIEKIVLPTEEYVLGEKIINGETTYVTWLKTKDTYYHGHYISNWLKARIDLFERALCSITYDIEFMNNNGGNEDVPF